MLIVRASKIVYYFRINNKLPNQSEILLLQEICLRPVRIQNLKKVKYLKLKIHKEKNEQKK